MRRLVRSTNPLRMTLLGAAALAVLLLLLPAAGSYAAWNDSAPIGGTVTTGSLGIDEDVVSGGTWTEASEAFDPATDMLTAGSTLTYTVSNVPVTAVGDNLEAIFQGVDGAVVPDEIQDHVTVDVTSDPTPVKGADSDADGHQDVTLVLTVAADGGLPSGAQTIDLSKLTVTLSNGHGWSDTATLDAATLTTDGGNTAPGGKVDLSYNLEYDADKVVGFYLQDPLPGTKIKWNLWGTDGEVTTDAVDGLNSMDYSGSTQTPYIEIVGGFEGFGSPNQSVELIGALTYVNGMNDAIGMTSASYAFKDAIHLGGLSGLPSTLTDTSFAFQNAGSARGVDSNIQIGNWDSSNVTTMAHMFDGATNFRQQDPQWDTSNVTDMSYMFAGATSFTGPIGFTSTANVTTMEGMFQGATSYIGANWEAGQHIASWDVSKVTNMANMFDGATSFNVDLNRWDTSSVTGMQGMFKGATSFNQNIGSWNTSNVSSFSQMFQDATAFNQNIGGWDTSAAKNMSQLFRDATTFNQDISGWDTSSVSTMQKMFQGAAAFSQNLSGWNVDKVNNYKEFSDGSALTSEQLPMWNSTKAAREQPSSSDAPAAADNAAQADEDQPAEATPDTTTPDATTEPEADTTTGTDTDEDDAAKEETPAPAPEEQVDPDQAIEALEEAWKHAQVSDTDEARQALEDAAKVVDELLGDGTADELVQQLEDEAAAATPSAPAMATPEGEQAD